MASFFESWGAAVVDADQLARQVVTPDSDGLAEIQKAFPTEHLILADGSLNRSKLASLIFANQAHRRLVESILHPRIRQLWCQRLAELHKTAPPLIVYVVPLYFESSQKMPEIEKVILVTAPDDLKVSRIMARDGFSREAAELRLKAQLPDSEKIGRSDYIIHNFSTVDQVRDRAHQVFAELASTPK